MDTEAIIAGSIMMVLLLVIVFFWQRQHKDAIDMASRKKGKTKFRKNDRVPTEYADHDKYDPHH